MFEIIESIAIIMLPIIITVLIVTVIIKFVIWDNRKREEIRIKREAEELYKISKLLEEMKKEDK